MILGTGRTKSPDRCPDHGYRFAGPRVIEQTIRQKLPKDFQKSEFLLDHGMIDDIVDRRELRSYIKRLLNFMMNPEIHGESDIERARRAAKLKE